MREIKFRAWNKNQKKIEPVLNIDWWPQDDGNLKIDIVTSHCKIKDELILMQFTGLKDKNGKEIYEGDILESQYKKAAIEEKRFLWVKICAEKGEKIVWREEVYWADCCFCLRVKGNPEDKIMDENDSKSIVIGNIYENPELLK